MIKFFNSIALTSLANAIEKLSSLIFIPVLARALAPNDFGELNAAYNLAFFLYLFIMNGQAGSTFLLKSQWNERFDYLHFESKILKINSGFAVVIAGLLLVNALFAITDVFLNVPSKILLICTMTFIASYPVVIRSTVWIIEERYKENLLLSVLRISLAIGLFFTLLNTDGINKQYIRPLAEVIATFLIGTFLVTSLFKQTAKQKLTQEDKNKLTALVRRSYKYGWTLQFSQLCFWAIASSDRIILNKILGGEATAFHAILMVGVIPIFIVSTLSNIISAKFNLLYAKGDVALADTLISKGYVGGVIVGLFYKLLLLLLADWIIPLYAGELYASLTQYLHLCGTVLIAYYLYLMASRRLHCVLDTRYIIIISVLAAVINIAINFSFIPDYGFIIAIYSTIISYFFISLLAVVRSDTLEAFRSCKKLLPLHLLCIFSIFLLDGIIFYYG